MNTKRKLFSLGIAASMLALVACEADNRYDQVESFREDHREWEQDYQERLNEIEEKRMEITNWRQGQDAPTAEDQEAQTRDRQDGDDQVATDPGTMQQLMARVEEMEQKHEAMKEEHQALMDKHNSFVNREDLATMNDQEWENQRDLIRSDHDRMENDLDRMENEIDELNNELDDITGDRDDRVDRTGTERDTRTNTQTPEGRN